MRNRELLWEMAGMLVVAVVLILAGAAMGCGVWTACVAAVCITMHFTSVRLRYRKIRQLHEDLDTLLLTGKPLRIARYSEGELSILADNIQKLTQRLTESSQKLREEKVFLADSLADISHQLRTPLTAMHLTAAMLSAPELSDQRRRELVMEMKTLLGRTQWLVEALLKLSKLDAGTVVLEKRTVAVSELIARAAEPLAVSMELREQRFSAQCGDAAFLGDLTWTAEALGNILKNCMEHTPNGGCITVTAQENPLFTQIIVDDTGPGFAEADIPHLFERFYKGKGSSNAGYGIGLALARTIVTAQNGTLQAMNMEQGARFVIKLYKQIL